LSLDYHIERATKKTDVI